MEWEAEGECECEAVVKVVEDDGESAGVLGVVGVVGEMGSTYSSVCVDAEAGAGAGTAGVGKYIACL